MKSNVCFCWKSDDNLPIFFFSFKRSSKVKGLDATKTHLMWKEWEISLDVCANNITEEKITINFDLRDVNVWDLVLKWNNMFYFKLRLSISILVSLSFLL